MPVLIALGRCVSGLISAASLMLIFVCIYAIIAVDEFRSYGISGEYVTVNHLDPFGVYLANGSATEGIESTTGRGYPYGLEYYGTFSRAMFTLFQVITHPNTYPSFRACSFFPLFLFLGARAWQTRQTCCA